jgi:TfoX/Sxy family transcriptional regulator of competence genes
MFGEYLVYINEKPILLVCDGCVFVKIVPCLDRIMADAGKGYPYDGAKAHYVLDVDDDALMREVVSVLERNTPLPRPRKKKAV